MLLIAAEIGVLLVLILANGFFAMSEIAVVSARKTRLERNKRQGDSGAAAALDLTNEPSHFLSTIQIGITLIGITAGAFAGATLAEQLGERLKSIAWLAPYSDVAGLGIVVVAITYVQLILGELAPKRLALSDPERISARVARVMKHLCRLAYPVVRVLSWSTDAVVWALPGRTVRQPELVEDEIRLLAQQATHAGAFTKLERQMLEQVLRLGERTIGSLMTPRSDAAWLDIRASRKTIENVLSEHFYSYFPVADGNLDHVLGVVHSKELLARSWSGEPIDLRDLLREPLYVDDDLTVLKAIELFRDQRIPVALVTNADGRISGLVTTTDILDAIGGDMPLPGARPEAPAVASEQDSWLVDGWESMDFVEQLAGDETGAEPAPIHARTVGAFAASHVGEPPDAGTWFEWRGLRFEVIAVSGTRIDKIFIRRRPAGAGERTE